MKQFKGRSINSSKIWNAKLRFKPNETVSHNGVVYQNVSGINTEPGTDDNWVVVSTPDNAAFIPLTGTSPGNPVTASIEFYPNNANYKLFKDNVGEDTHMELSFEDNLIRLLCHLITDPTTAGQIILANGAVSITSKQTDFSFTQEEGISFTGLDAISKGIKSDIDHSPNLTDLAYPQKIYVDNKTGWATYIDTLHTVGSPQNISESLTPVLLTNNAGTVINSQLPDEVTAFFDSATTKLTPFQQNDFHSVDLMFYVKNSTTNGFFSIYIDIPTLGKRFEQTFPCPKTAGTQMGVNYSLNHFVSAQFAANGGFIYIVAESGNLQIYDKQYRICRTHRAK